MGLKTGTVRIEEYNNNWPKEYEEEKKNLKGIFKDVAITIEHVGSTSIEGLSAKPIIDIAVSVNKLIDFERVRKEFINNKNYSIREENDPGEILVRKGTIENITHFIHVMEYKSDRYRNAIIFRDYLRNNIKDKKEYEILKKELAEKYKNDRKMYTSSKNNFIQEILRKAKKEKKNIDKFK